MARKKGIARKIGKHTAEIMRTALEAIASGKSIRKASEEFKIPFTTLQRYKTNASKGKHNLTPDYYKRKIFTAEQEQILREYYVKCAGLFYGLTTKDCRKVAYEMAKHNNIQVPPSWEENEMAGLDWLRGFRERFPDLSLRKPENCSLARATAFNKVTVKNFFNNLEQVLLRRPEFTDGTRIFNLDETGTGTVMRSPKVMATKGKRNICKVASGEKGTLVTTCCIVSAGGVALPPAIVFPRKTVKPAMSVGVPPGSLIQASLSGWMNSELFVDVMKHFIKVTGSTKDYQSILILVNHESHLSIKALDLAKESGVTVLTLHPHTSAKLQPLDVGIYGPFKTYYAAAMESWMLRHPGVPCTIYDVGELIGKAFERAMTSTNIKQAFKKTGIFPFDRHVFTDEDFLTSSVTDRPETMAQGVEDCQAGPSSQQQQEVRDEEMEGMVQSRDEDTPSPSIVEALLDLGQPPTISTEAAAAYIGLRDITNILSVEQSATPPLVSHASSPDHVTTLLVPAHASTSVHVTPPSIANDSTSGYVTPPLVAHASTSGHVTPPPGDHASISSHVTQALGFPAIPSTSVKLITPEDFRKPFKAGARKGTRKPRKLGRSLIATDTPEKEEIRVNKEKQKKVQPKKKSIHKLNKKAVRHLLQSDSEEDFVPLQDDSSNEGDWLEDEQNQEIITEACFKTITSPPKEGQYVLVEFTSKKQKVFYVAKVLEERNDSLELFVSFMRHKKARFVMPDVPDVAYVKDDTIERILPKPTLKGSTARQQSYYEFCVDLSGFHVR